MKKRLTLLKEGPMKTVFTDKAPIPAGHYSQATVSGHFIFVSGQLPIHPETKQIPENIQEQAEQALQNIDAILLEAGSSRQGVLKATVYISDIALWDEVNKTYAAFFGQHRPARSIVPTRELHFGCKIEIDVIAELESFIPSF